MPPLWQRITVIILIFVSIILMGIILYWFFWRPILGPAPIENNSIVQQLITGGDQTGRTTSTVGTGQLPIDTEPTEQPASQTPTQPETAGRLSESDLSALVKESTRFSSITKGGNVVYYNPDDGKFYQSDINGNISELSPKTFFGANNAIFDNNGKKAIIEFPDSSNIVYDFDAEKQYTLPKHWEDFGFSPTGEEIIFKNIANDIENRFLVTAKYDGSSAQIIESIGVNANKVFPNWSPNGQVVATYHEGLDSSRSEIFLIGQNKENFKSLTVNGRDFRGLWSPTNEKILYSVYDVNDGYKPQLWISSALGDNVGDNRQKINLQTWVDKCTFAGENYAFCSAPQTLAYGSGLEPQINNDARDEIWAIDLKTGQTQLLLTPNTVTKIQSLMFNENNPNELLISSANSGWIYKLKIQ